MSCHALRELEEAEAYYRQKLTRAKFYLATYERQHRAIARIKSVAPTLKYDYSHRYFLEHYDFEKSGMKLRRYASEENLDITSEEIYTFGQMKNYLLTGEFHE